MARRKSVLMRQLDEMGVELYIVRGMQNEIKGVNDTLTAEIKGLMLDELNSREYDGERVRMVCLSRSLPSEVDVSVVAAHIPFKDFLHLVKINKDALERYLEEHPDIDLNKQAYLREADRVDALSRPTLKVSPSSLEGKFQRLYSSMAQKIVAT